MKTYWDALLRRAQQRVFRWGWTFFMAVGVVLNIWGTIRSITGQERGMSWIVNAACVVVLILMWLFWLMPIWMRDDAAYRARRQAFSVEPIAEPTGPVTESIPLIPSSEATDPRVYAMMRTLETGEPVSIYRDDEGVWRDSDTDEVLPVQGEPDEGGRP